MKRAFDFLAALTGLILVSPLLLLCAIVMKLTDRGPVFFRQPRVGLNGKPFTMWKLRSMRVSAGSSAPQITIAGDSRITPVGRFLRATKMDEFPQLWNVIK